MSDATAWEEPEKLERIYKNTWRPSVGIIAWDVFFIQEDAVGLGVFASQGERGGESVVGRASQQSIGER